MKKLIELDRQDMPKEYLELSSYELPKFNQFMLYYGLFNIYRGKIISSKIELYKILSYMPFGKKKIKEIVLKYAGKEVYFADRNVLNTIYSESEYIHFPKEAFEK